MVIESYGIASLHKRVEGEITISVSFTHLSEKLRNYLDYNHSKSFLRQKSHTQKAKSINLK